MALHRCRLVRIAVLLPLPIRRPAGRALAARLQEPGDELRPVIGFPLQELGVRQTVVSAPADL